MTGTVLNEKNPVLPIDRAKNNRPARALMNKRVFIYGSSLVTSVFLTFTIYFHKWNDTTIHLYPHGRFLYTDHMQCDVNEGAIYEKELTMKQTDLLFTGKDAPILLASTAAMEAKIAGSNAFQLRLVRANKGTISTFSTKVFGSTYASAGLTETQAKAEGFTYMVGEYDTMDRHPGSLPDAQKVHIKLLFSKCSGVILGAQIYGGDTVAEIVNILSLAITSGMTATELNTFQTATHPLVSASPIAYPINAAAMNALATNCNHLNQGLVI